MPSSDASMSSWTTLSAVGVIALGSFPVSWLLTMSFACLERSTWRC